MTVYKGLLAPQTHQPMGLLADPKMARVDAFFSGLGGAGARLIAAGSASTDPGNFGRQMAQVGPAYQHGFQNSMGKSRQAAFDDFRSRHLADQVGRQQKQQVARDRLANAAAMGGKDMAGKPVNKLGLLAEAYPDEMAKTQIQGLLSSKAPIQVAPGASLVDPNTREAIYTAPNRPAAPTSLQRNLREAGLQPGTPQYTNAILASIKKPGVSVNMQPGETEANKALGKSIGARLGGQLDSGDKAMSNLQTLDLMSRAADQWEQAGASTGALADEQAFATGLLQAVNIDPTSLGLPADAGAAQILGSLSNKLVLGKIGGEGGMPANNFSDADRKFIQSTVPQLSDTPMSFRTKLMIDRKMAERSIQIAGTISDMYAEGKTTAEINRAVNGIKKQPLFAKDEQARIMQIAQTQSTQAPEYKPDGGGDAALLDRLKSYGANVQAPQGYTNPVPRGDYGPFRQLP